MSFEHKSFTRRTALQGTAMVTLAQVLAACSGKDDPGQKGSSGGEGGIEGSYGKLIDHDGVISLPEGFRYVAFAAAGSKMSDGSSMPGAHDGMTCFPGKGSQVILLRNQELEQLDAMNPDPKFYDGMGGGGVTVSV